MITQLRNDDYGLAQNIFSAVSRFPADTLYPIVVTTVLCLILLGTLELFYKQAGDRKELNGFAFPNVKVTAAAAFIFITVNLMRHYALLDEVAINLKHSYNLEGTEVLLLDDDGKQVGDNEVGQIVARSRYLSKGYWRRPDLTEAKFKSDPNGGQERLYLTGDLGLMRTDGCLLYKGRKDFRVKIRGYGVEVAEVEKRLLNHPDVREAIVAKQNPLGESYLVAYFTVQSQSAPTVSELRCFLLEKLTDYMVPSAFVMLDAMPLTAHGKLDRTVLPVPDGSRPQLDVAYAGPRTSVEERLVEIWQEILDIRPVGIHDNFSDVGGHSLAGAGLISRLNRTFGLDLSIRVLFKAPTVARLTSVVEVEQWNLSNPSERR